MVDTNSSLYSELDWHSERLSSRVWSVSLGVLATSLAFVIEASKPDGTPFLNVEHAMIPAGIALLALTFDLVHYLAAYFQHYSEYLRGAEARHILARERSGTFFKSVRFFAFFSKVSLSLIAAAAIIYLSADRLSARLVDAPAEPKQKIEMDATSGH